MRQAKLGNLPASPSAAFLVVGRAPTPGARAEATGHNALAIDIRDDVPVSGQKRLGRTHLGADGQLALGGPVAPVLLELCLTVVLFGTAGAEGTFVHLAARAEVASLRELRRAERARVEAIAAADAEVLGVENHA